MKPRLRRPPGSRSQEIPTLPGLRHDIQGEWSARDAQTKNIVNLIAVTSEVIELLDCDAQLDD